MFDVCVINSIARFGGDSSFFFVFRAFATCSGIPWALYICTLAFCVAQLFFLLSINMPNTNLECACRELLVCKLQLSGAMDNMVSCGSPPELQ